MCVSLLWIITIDKARLFVKQLGRVLIVTDAVQMKLNPLEVMSFRTEC